MASRKDSVRPYTRTEQVQTTLTKKEQQRLDRLAKLFVISRAEMIHRYINEGMDRDDNPNPPAGWDVYEEIQRLKKELYG